MTSASINNANEPTIKDVLVAMSDFSSHVDQRFDRLENRMDRMEGRQDNMEGRLDKIEATMVTKDYLDDKLADLKGDLTVLIRKEDHKMTALVKLLHHKQILSEQEADQIFAMEPFPQTVLR
ncbi:MAG: hypothetical protein HYV33_06000 [Candidatus Kerfeldbacteria bacterium]|nr:hypothetical protein [Candidatus Kerfeldbacteria bacterium]